MAETPEAPPAPQESPRDAICFTSGPQGLFFGAGVIHAHLAADRSAPAVVAGISSGAISASAMQRVYKELSEEKRRTGASPIHVEATRWAWLQRYIAALTDKPVNVFWDSLPNPNDFFADENVPGLRDTSLPDDLQKDEMHARRQKYLLQHLGIWCAALSIKVSTLTTAIVNFVRYKERYSGSWFTLWRKYYGGLGGIVIRLLWHIFRNPVMVQETLFDDTVAGPRPLLGWEAWLMACTTLFLLLLIAGGVLGAMLLLGLGEIVEGLQKTWHLPGTLAPFLKNHLVDRFLLVAGIAGLAGLIAVILCRSRIHEILVAPMLSSIGFGRSLLHNFPARKRIRDLFGHTTLDDQPMPALLVAAPLQTLYRTNEKKEKEPVSSRQLWATPRSGIYLDDALVATIALPGVWQPHSENRAGFSQWSPLPEPIRPIAETAPAPDPESATQTTTTLSRAVEWVRTTSKALNFQAAPLSVPVDSHDPEPLTDTLDLIDGVAVRHNPLPALLDYLKRHPRAAGLLTRDAGEPSIHVVYSVPLEGPPGNGRVSEDGANIVNVALTSQRLAARRDTSMEVDQLNTITRLEREVRQRGGEANPGVIVAFADEIAPEAEPIDREDLHNPLTIRREAAIKNVAAGCRRTLEKIYRNELARMPQTDGVVECRALICRVAGGRAPVLADNATAPGLHEVCDQCTGKLRVLPPVPVTVPPCGGKGSSLLNRFPNLQVYSGHAHKGRNAARPRIVFLWSGGVFRGSFHIGMIAALLTANIKPDLIAGASVGTLMGGTLASIFSLTGAKERQDLLAVLVQVFREVDDTVALTKTLKEATRDLGIRGRSIRLSPRMVRDTVRKGIQADPGYAATGAPPALIDAISTLLSIPLVDTEKIAGDFIAGLVAEATEQLLGKIKEHTLKRLNIQAALIGDSLLRQQVAKLIGALGIDCDCDQPFTHHGIAFLATATDLGAQAQVVFGDNPAHRGRHYDFRASTLASSAFPAVFAPKRQSDVLPGQGRVDVRYCDGGIFDNLPFFPAIDSLARVQCEETDGWNDEALRQYIVDRSENPDLLIAGALNARPETALDANGPFDSYNQISQRAKRLGDNSKIHSFVDAAQFGYEQFGRLAAVHSNGSPPDFIDRDFVRRFVNVAVLPVFPSDKKHLNPTFAFCKSTGLKKETLARSIGDGCFQTFHTLSTASGEGSESVKQSLHRIYESRKGKIRKISKTQTSLPAPDPKGKICPYFQCDGAPLECPFATINQLDITAECAKDEAHRGYWPTK